MEKLIDNITSIHDIKTMIIDYLYIKEYLENIYPDVSPNDFYRDIFQYGNLQKKGIYEKGKYNGIFIEILKEKQKNKSRIKRYTVTDEMDNLSICCSSLNFCLMSPISYVGKTRESKNARELYALAFDLDGIQAEKRNDKLYPFGLESLIFQFDNLKVLPKPTYIVWSGTGLHLYYVFNKAVPMYKDIVDELEILKKELTRKLWSDSISYLYDKVQYEPVCQGFRMVGSITKLGDRVKAFKVGNKIDLDYLNEFVRNEYRIKNFTYQSSLSLKNAKELYPDWYEKRIEKKLPVKSWKFNRAVYDKWLLKISEEATLGHRYWCVWSLAVTAYKCGVSFTELENDAFSLIDVMNQKDKSNKQPFTPEDITSALDGYDVKWITYPLDKISYRTNINIIKTKRNYKKQEYHLEDIRDIKRKMKERGIPFKHPEGRPSKQKIVLEWRKLHPMGKKSECISETKIDKKTVYKWWDSRDE